MYVLQYGKFHIQRHYREHFYAWEPCNFFCSAFKSSCSFWTRVTWSVLCERVWEYVCVSARVHTCMHVYVYPCAYSCTFMCIWICIYTTHTPTNTRNTHKNTKNNHKQTHKHTGTMKSLLRMCFFHPQRWKEHILTHIQNTFSHTFRTHSHTHSECVPSIRKAVTYVSKCGSAFIYPLLRSLSMCVYMRVEWLLRMWSFFHPQTHRVNLICGIHLQTSVP